MDDLVESITRGNVSQVKVVLASVVIALAVYQLVLIAVGYGKIKVPFLKPKPASFTHRTVGDSIATLVFVIAFMCLAYFGIDDGIEHARDEESGRAAVHVVAALLLLGVLAFKIAVVRWWHSLGRFLPILGLSVFGLLLVTWLTSAGNYLAGR